MCLIFNLSSLIIFLSSSFSTLLSSCVELGWCNLSKLFSTLIFLFKLIDDEQVLLLPLGWSFWLKLFVGWLTYSSVKLFWLIWVEGFKGISVLISEVFLEFVLSVENSALDKNVFGLLELEPRFP